MELDRIPWRRPWAPAASGPLEIELARELAPGHQLFGAPVSAVARRMDEDTVLFALGDGTGRFALVHLTWRGGTEPDPRWPHAEYFASLDDWYRDVFLPDTTAP